MDDLDDVAAIFSNRRVMKYLGVNSKPISKDDTRQILESIERLWQNKGYGRMAVISRENNKLIGMAGLRYYEGEAELFYLLDELFWGKGLATEIGLAVLEHSFETYNFPQIIAVTRPANTATLRVLDKLGLNFEKEIVIQKIRAYKFSISLQDFQLKNTTPSIHYSLKHNQLLQMRFGY